MIEPNILAFQNAALLEALADPALRHLTTIAALAEHLGKDKSNLRKTMALLVEADLLLADPLQHGLSVAGHAQLAAFKRAQHGGERRKSRGRWPLDKLQRNPANRTIDPDAVLGLADTIVSAGDILQPLTLSPPDAHGVRTIWIGERRWIAATRLLQLGQLPDALVEGVPFVEREANAGEAAVITLIENTARQDLTPWEDAQQLRRAAEAHPDWSASELARRIGRAREGDRGGVRDVQQKLKIAREATPEAIARYEADPAAPRAWEDLRDSVTQPKPVERPNPTAELSAALKVHGPVAASAGEPSASAGAPNAEDDPWLAGGWRVVDSRFFSGAAIPPEARGFDLTTYSRVDGEGVFAVTRYRCRARIVWSNGSVLESTRIPGTTSRTAAIQLATDDLRHDRPDLPRATIEALDKLSGPFVVAGKDCYNATNAGARRRAIGWEKSPANHGGGSQSQRPAATDQAPRPKAPESASPPTIEHPTNRVLRLIAEERYRQVTEAGYAPEHDDVQNDENELALAAGAYIESAIGAHDPAGAWPSTWDADAFNPRTPEEDLIRAGALIVAELERLHRAAGAA